MLLILAVVGVGHAFAAPAQVPDPTASATNWCGTSADWPAKAPDDSVNACGVLGKCDDPDQRDATIVVPLTIATIVHVIFSDPETNGIDQAAVDLMVRQLNDHYSPAGIQFDLRKTRFHQDAVRASLPPCKPERDLAMDELKSAYAEDVGRAFNIFVSRQETDASRCPKDDIYGKGVFPFDPEALLATGGLWLNVAAIGVPNTATPGIVLAHEMGHCLGLWHVFHGVSEVDSCGPCTELVDRTFADRTGDLCSDTPAVPVKLETDCSNPATVDCDNESWAPVARGNFMDLARECVGRFSEQQMRRMQCWTLNALGGLTTCDTSLCTDHFSDDALAPWVVESGGWIESGSTLTGSGTPEASIRLAYRDWSISSAQVRMQLLVGAHRGFRLRSADGEVGVSLLAGPTNQAQIDNGMACYLFDLPNEVLDWSTVHLFLASERINLWIDGRFVGSAPLAPHLVDSYFEGVVLYAESEAVANFADLLVHGRHRFVADRLEIVGRVDTPVTAQDVAIAGQYAYVADTGGDLQVINIEDPSAPRIVGSLALESQSYDVAINGNTAYVAQNWAGLAVVDISVREAPRLLALLETPGYALAVRYRDNLVYVALRTAGVLIVDVTDPASPRILGRHDTDGAAGGVTLSGNVAFLSASDYLIAVDVSDAGLPVRLGTLSVGNGATNSEVVGSHAFIADSFAGLMVADVTNPSAMNAIATLNTSGQAWDIDVVADLAYLADGGSGLQVIDVGDLEAPILRGTVDTPGHAYGLTVLGDFVYVADGEAGLAIIWRHPYIAGVELEVPPAAIRIERIIPNPFNPRTTIAFTLAGAARVRARVFDVAGRCVAQLADTDFAAGRNEIEWAGSDKADRACAAGVYFVRLEALGGVATRKLTLVR